MELWQLFSAYFTSRLREGEAVIKISFFLPAPGECFFTDRGL